MRKDNKIPTREELCEIDHGFTAIASVDILDEQGDIALPITNGKNLIFADIFERDLLTFEERELATISALTAMDGVEPMRRGHIGIGRNLGMTEAQIQEAASLIAISKTTLFPKGVEVSGSLFIGTAFVNMLVPRDETGHYAVADVIFEPGARNNWHTHSAGQILLVTEGKGFYQERGKPVQQLAPGDVIVIPSKVWHWHGATKDSRFAHIAITGISGAGGGNLPMEPLTEAEYDAAHK